MQAVESYLRANSVAEVLAVMEQKPQARLLAGGTDLLLHLQENSGEAISLIDISDIAELEGIETTIDGLHIGAATKMEDIVRSNVLTGSLEALVQGAAEVGSHQIRHLATIGGNICNASPSADAVLPLLALDAKATIVSSRGRRYVPLTDFFVSPGRTVLNEGELLTSVLIPTHSTDTVSLYIKLKIREVLDLAIVGVSVVLSQKNGHLAARIALGAVAPTPIRATQAEQLLWDTGTPDQTTFAEAGRLAEAATTPIDDARGTAWYRKNMVRVLTEQALQQAYTRLNSSTEVRDG